MCNDFDDDKSKITLTGEGKDIDIELAWKYYDLYVAGRACSADYQRYPKKDCPEITLQEKIKELEKREEMQNETRGIAENIRRT